MENDGVAHKLLFKSKLTYIVMYKAIPGSYWIQRLTLCEVLGRPRIKSKELTARMDKISPTMVIHNHVDGEDTIFVNIPGTLFNNPLGKCLGVIRRGT